MNEIRAEFDSLDSFDLTCSVNIEAAHEEGGLRQFSMHAYTGGPMYPKGFTTPVVVNLAGMRRARKSLPILRDHDLSKVVGHTEDKGGGGSFGVKISESDIYVEGTISGVGPDAQEVIQASANGFEWQASIGASIVKKHFLPRGRSEVVNGRKVTGPMVVADVSHMREVSFVAVGADERSHAIVAAANNGEEEMNFLQWLQANGFVADSESELSDSQRTILLASFEASEAVESEGEGESEGAAADAAAAVAVEAGAGGARFDMRMMRRAAETRTNIQQIEDICARAGHPRIEAGGRQVDLASHALSEGWTPLETEVQALRAQRASTPAIHVNNSSADPTTIEAALCIRAGLDEGFLGTQYSQETMNRALEARNRPFGSLHHLYHMVIKAAGLYYPAGVVDDGFIRAAHEASNLLTANNLSRHIEASTGGFSTLSLPTLLGNVANKTAVAAFMSVGTIWQRFCATANHQNFHKYTRVRLHGNGQFLKVAPDGEIKHHGVGEATYENQVETWGRMFSLTRQDQINDDLGQFLRIPTMIGRGGAVSLEEEVHRILMGSSTLFTVPQGNLITDALDVAGLQVAYTAFLNAVDENNKPIGIDPTLLLVPPQLWTTAQQLFNDLEIHREGADNLMESNAFRGMFTPIMSRYLGNANIVDKDGKALPGVSATDWYLLASPDDVGLIEVAFLQGRQTPIVESESTVFNKLGVEFRGYFDFGVSEQEYRYGVKSDVP